MLERRLGLEGGLRQKGLFPSDKTQFRGCTKGYPGYRSLFPRNYILQQGSKRNLQSNKKKEERVSLHSTWFWPTGEHRT
uniref:Uncharacterized protein n=1 Tax=Rhizophora mucronata TaxID=61149 RepID=A0A2P2IZQ5_RHIMU